jgi:hypothetical protein
MPVISIIPLFILKYDAVKFTVYVVIVADIARCNVAAFKIFSSSSLFQSVSLN